MLCELLPVLAVVEGEKEARPLLSNDALEQGHRAQGQVDMVILLGCFRQAVGLGGKLGGELGQNHFPQVAAMEGHAEFMPASLAPHDAMEWLRVEQLVRKDDG